MTQPSVVVSPSGRRRAVSRWIGAAVIAAAVGGTATIDVPQRLGGLKGDEATYIAMTLSLAHDRDLKFTRTDLRRFERVYGSGPEGLFLKQGATLALDWQHGLPHLVRTPRNPDASLEFGKAFVYPLVAAPFVVLFGLSGMLVLNVLLIAAVTWMAAEYAAAEGGRGGTVFATAFVFASISPIYAVWLTPEVLNWALVFGGYFLWLYKRTRAVREGTAGWGWLRSPSTDIAAALLLGLATFSKPPNALLIIPLGIDALLKRRIRWTVVLAVAFLVTSAGLFGINALVSGEWNYQGGDRRTFYGRYPFSDPQATFATTGVSMATDNSDAQDLLAPHVLWPMLKHNVVYFIVGRDAGLLPYFFPGLVALVLWLARRGRGDPVRLAIAGVLFASVAVLLVLAPDSWAGGGGPPGDRYFLSLYPVMFFLAPAVGLAPALIALVVGLVFVGPWLVAPFASSKAPWRWADAPTLRELPIELTMVDNLPVRLSPEARIPFGLDPQVLLYFMDDRASTPEGHGLWVHGDGTAEIIVRADHPLGRLKVTWHSPIDNRVWVSINGRRADTALEAGRPETVFLQVGPGVTGANGSQGYVLRLHADRGFHAQQFDPGSKDVRNLGAFADLFFE